MVIVGDMNLTLAQHRFLYENGKDDRAILKGSFNRWPDGIVLIKINEDGYTEDRLKIVKAAMSYIANASCIKFNLNSETFENYVVIVKGDGCSSNIGNLQKGAQYLMVNEICTKGNIIHELLHVLGFLHMHTNAQRDDFIKIYYENIRPENLKNFEKFKANVSMYNTEYDYRSILHYRKNAFAIDRSKPTITPVERVANIGQRNGEIIGILFI